MTFNQLSTPRVTTPRLVAGQWGMTDMHPTAARLYEAFAALKPPVTTQTGIARALGHSSQVIKNWEIRESGVSQGGATLAQEKMGISASWIIHGTPPMLIEAPSATMASYQIAEGQDGRDDVLPIPFKQARGSCGGGSVAGDDVKNRPSLYKEASWFSRYKVRPEDLIAVWADGDSMAEFIVDGDIVIFNILKTEPKSGKIFLIQHPDGLRIKRLRRDIDGSWVLESGNADKRQYPDERITVEQLDILRVKGEFVYRQGG